MIGQPSTITVAGPSRIRAGFPIKFLTTPEATTKLFYASKTLKSSTCPATDDISPDGFRPVHFAAYFGQHSAAQFLLAHGGTGRARSQNSVGVTPLNSAATGRHSDLIIRLLLKFGASVDSVDAAG